MNTKHKIIRDHILAEIESGAYQVGQRIATEAELAKRFGASVTSAHRAIKSLEERGLVERVRRNGTFVTANGVGDEAELSGDGLKPIHAVFSTKEDQVHWREATVRSLSETVAARGYKLKHVDFHSKKAAPEDFERLIDGIVEEGSSGVVMSFYRDLMKLIGRSCLTLRDSVIPFCLHNRSARHIPNLVCDSISMDPFGDGIQIGRLVERAGYESVLFLMTDRYRQIRLDQSQGWIDLRREGVELVFGESGVRLVETEGEFSKVCREIKGEKRGARPCLVALNDIVGARFMDCAKENELSVPADCELVAFDDNPEVWPYNITTLAAPLEKIGRRLGEMICDRKDDKNDRLIWEKIPYELVERETFGIKHSSESGTCPTPAGTPLLNGVSLTSRN